MFSSILLLLGLLGQDPPPAPITATPRSACNEPAPSGCREQARSTSGATFAVVQGDCNANVFRGVAMQFLTGCGEDCHPPTSARCHRTADLHVPSGCEAHDLHLELDANEDHAIYYRDATKRLASGLVGDDANSRFGLESTNVIFHVGHGGIDKCGDNLLLDLGNKAQVCLDDTHLGDGKARYLLLASCQVMAHGPRLCDGGEGREFACPQDYQADAYERPKPEQEPGRVRNVFDRWPARMAPALRMVCGGSSIVYPEHLAELFWQYRLVYELPVADSYLLALTDTPPPPDSEPDRIERVTPLCLTHGDRVPASTPLFDIDFKPEPNRSDCLGPFLHAMYPVYDQPALGMKERDQLKSFGLEDVTTGEEAANSTAPPKGWLPPILIVRKQVPIPAAPNSDPRFGFHTADKSALRRTAGGGARKLAAEVQPDNGSILVSVAQGDRKRQEAADRLSAALLRPWLASPYFSPPQVSRISLRVDRVLRADALDAQPECFRTCDYIRIRPSVSVPISEDGTERVSISLFGPGAEWLIGTCPSGPGEVGSKTGDCPAAGRGLQRTVFHVPAYDGEVWEQDTKPALRGRRFEELGEEEKGKQFRQLGIPAGPIGWHPVGNPRLGYYVGPSNCTQTHLLPYYRLTYQEDMASHGTEHHRLEVIHPVYELTPDEEKKFDTCVAPAGD
jgi:hypothetical protein